MATKLVDILRQLVIDYANASYWTGLYEGQGQDEYAEQEEQTTMRIQDEIDYILGKLGGIDV